MSSRVRRRGQKRKCKRHNLDKILCLLLIAASLTFCIAAYSIVSYFVKSNKENRAFEELAAEAAAGAEYTSLYEKNNDLFGWIYIAGTNINYPVMYTPEDPEYYLYRDFNKSESKSGVPFLDGNCTADGGIYLIYGHNMKNGTMFASLLSYDKKEFWEKHKTITFNHISEKNEYEVIAAFYSMVHPMDTEGFRYYQYTDLSDADVFNEYMENVKALALYDTGICAEYGDEILALSTCSYNTKNGRFVVIAKRIK